MSEAWFTTRHDVLTQQPYLWLQIFRGRRGPEVLIVDYTSRRIIQLCTFRRAWPGQGQEPDDRLFRRSWGWHLLRASEEPCWRWVTMQLHCKFNSFLLCVSHRVSTRRAARAARVPVVFQRSMLAVRRCSACQAWGMPMDLAVSGGWICGVRDGGCEWLPGRAKARQLSAA